MITVENLVFEYPGVRALNDVSFTVHPGSITALVGPNGAGKSTLLRCIAALDEPVSGTVRLEGVDVLENPRLCHRNLGFLSDFFGLYEDLTAGQCLRYIAMAHGISKDLWQNAVALAADRVGIGDRLNDKTSTLSRGLRQRLAIAQAIIHQPRVVLLDEPASGLDPEARSALAGLFLSLRDQGMTLMVSSHILTELEEYSTDMLILKAGEIAGQRQVRARKTVASLFKVSLVQPSEALAIVLGEVQGVTDIRVHDRQGWFRFAGDAKARHDLLQRMLNSGVPVCAFAEEHADMQHEYLEVVQLGNDRKELRS